MRSEKFSPAVNPAGQYRNLFILRDERLEYYYPPKATEKMVIWETFDPRQPFYVFELSGRKLFINLSERAQELQRTWPAEQFQKRIRRTLGVLGTLWAIDQVNEPVEMEWGVFPGASGDYLPADWPNCWRGWAWYFASGRCGVHEGYFLMDPREI